MSLIIELTMLVTAAIMLVIKDNVQCFFIFMGLAGLFDVSVQLGNIYRVLSRLEKSYSDKVLAEKTLSTLMSAARKQVDDGK